MAPSNFSEMVNHHFKDTMSFVLHYKGYILGYSCKFRRHKTTSSLLKLKINLSAKKNKTLPLFTLILQIGSVACILLRKVFSSEGEKQRVGYLGKQNNLNIDCKYKAKLNMSRYGHSHSHSLFF